MVDAQVDCKDPETSQYSFTKSLAPVSRTVCKIRVQNIEVLRQSCWGREDATTSACLPFQDARFP